MAEEATGGEAPTVKSIFVYPVKSCRGISVSQASLASTGLRWDRLWMVVNAQSGRMLTQRVAPKLALVQVDLPLDAFSPSWKPNKTSFLVMSAPGMNVLKIPLVEPRAVANGISVWDWHGSAFDEGEEAATWFSDYLEKPSRLVRFNEASETRPITYAHGLGHNIRFTDAYPFHLVSQKSLDALNDQLQEPIPVDRFRPNFLIDGCEPFSEDLWDEIKINGLTFREGELCYRCKIPTINQETAEGGSEPNATLRKFRNDKTLFPNKEKPQGRIYMGITLVSTNCTPDNNGNKSIRVGDPIHVLKTFSSYADCRN
ncbi:mitochondrial amidoxime reducing component 2 [Phtheirospermum japonicum]|uniref:Mitochondrial amidoxime reducing component 2 n=1 Tax=Phtheirospermum japonicum TaxID=374723 RepID=A0A830CPE3_9LAMI|nr:mitochondrial amidoxime reducing component 2 [Phtheirospermum japonicum]